MTYPVLLIELLLILLIMPVVLLKLVILAFELLILSIYPAGAIILLSKDADSSKKVIKSVKNVRTTAKLIDEYIEAERTKYAVRGRDMIGSHIHGDHDCDEIIDDEVIV